MFLNFKPDTIGEIARVLGAKKISPLFLKGDRVRFKPVGDGLMGSCTLALLKFLGGEHS